MAFADANPLTTSQHQHPGCVTAAAPLPAAGLYDRRHVLAQTARSIVFRRGSGSAAATDATTAAHTRLSHVALEVVAKDWINDPYSTPARRRRLIHEVSRVIVFSYKRAAAERVAAFRVECAAATVIQAHARRRFAAVIYTAALHERQVQACVRVQLWWRRWRAWRVVAALRLRTAQARENKAAVAAQRAVRQWRARRQVAEMKRAAAALVIQRAARTQIVRHHAQQAAIAAQQQRQQARLVARAAVAVQAIARQKLARKHYAVAQQQRRAATALQRVWRGTAVRAAASAAAQQQRQQCAAVAVQCAARALLARRHVQHVKAALEEEHAAAAVATTAEREADSRSRSEDTGDSEAGMSPAEAIRNECADEQLSHDSSSVASKPAQCTTEEAMQEHELQHVRTAEVTGDNSHSGSAAAAQQPRSQLLVCSACGHTTRVNNADNASFSPQCACPTCGSQCLTRITAAAASAAEREELLRVYHQLQRRRQRVRSLLLSARARQIQQCFRRHQRRQCLRSWAAARVAHWCCSWSSVRAQRRRYVAFRAAVVALQTAARRRAAARRTDVLRDARLSVWLQHAERACAYAEEASALALFCDGGDGTQSSMGCGHKEKPLAEGLFRQAARYR
ncbi:hypothetical protein JKP88DRAFT_292852 [Tribonema minus]|uniref:Uncharacterized protein n=1 Tax=Tribonema minus TaxID=303371 RepID=A0A835ZEY7_9STRA|nr:hypothetical protein JKP88DRAFT_292852 [Tribonema minus]